MHLENPATVCWIIFNLSQSSSLFFLFIELFSWFCIYICTIICLCIIHLSLCSINKCFFSTKPEATPYSFKTSESENVIVKNFSKSSLYSTAVWGLGLCCHLASNDAQSSSSTHRFPWSKWLAVRPVCVSVISSHRNAFLAYFVRSAPSKLSLTALLNVQKLSYIHTPRTQHTENSNVPQQNRQFTR